MACRSIRDTNQKVARFLLSVVLPLLSGCATLDLQNIGQEGYAVEADEKRLMNRSDEVSEQLDQTDAIYGLPGLEDYLTQLTESLTPQEARDHNLQLSVKVLNDPSFNAFAMPNGRIYIHLGALSTCENEAQLVTLIGHEMTHILHRHSVKRFRSLQNKAAFMSVLTYPLAFAGGGAGVLLGELGVVSSMYGYSRETEYEADVGGFEVMKTYGYDAREAPKMFENLLSFLTDEEIDQPFFFATHPNVKARIKNFENLLSQSQYVPGPNAKVQSPVFESFVPQIKVDNIALCLKQGLFKTAEKSLEHFIKSYPARADAFYLGGEIYRQRQDHGRDQKVRDKKNDFPKALEYYEKSLAIDPQFADAVLGKAKVLERMGQVDAAKDVYKQYLIFAPQSSERAYIEEKIK